MAPEPGQHLSWWTLERYALGELSPEELVRVHATLAIDSESRRRLAAIQEDQRPLPKLVPSAKQPSPLRRWFALPVMALALVLVFTILPAENLDTVASVKGDAMAIKLVARRGDIVFEAPERIAVEDVLKIFLTCTVPTPVQWRLWVEHAGRIYEPLEYGDFALCINAQSLPGAFRLVDAGEAKICVTLSQGRESWTDCIDVLVE